MTDADDLTTTARRIAELTEIRAREPDGIAEGLGRPDAPRPAVGADGRLLIVAADHPARGALGVRDDAMAMASRAATCSTAWSRRCRGPGSTACSAPPTSSTTCCCSGRSRARS